MTTVGYQYVTLRLVPSVPREEFLNVGVVLYSQMQDFLGLDFALDADRVHAMDPGLDQDEVLDALRTARGLCRPDCDLGPGRQSLGQRFGWLSAPRSTVVQPGPIHGGVTPDAAAELQRLMQVLVLR